MPEGLTQTITTTLSKIKRVVLNPNDNFIILINGISLIDQTVPPNKTVNLIINLQGIVT